MLCYAMLCYAMLCYAMLCYAILCYAMLYYVRGAEGRRVAVVVVTGEAQRPAQATERCCFYYFCYDYLAAAIAATKEKHHFSVGDLALRPSLYYAILCYTMLYYVRGDLALRPSLLRLLHC